MGPVRQVAVGAEHLVQGDEPGHPLAGNAPGAHVVPGDLFRGTQITTGCADGEFLGIESGQVQGTGIPAAGAHAAAQSAEFFHQDGSSTAAGSGHGRGETSGTTAGHGHVYIVCQWDLFLWFDQVIHGYVALML